MMHGNDWTGQDVSGWWASEKLNGWRIWWDGSAMRMRLNNRLVAPDWFTANQPAFELDMELHMGRGCTDTDVHRAVAAREWSRLRLTAFDVPGYLIESAIKILNTLPDAVAHVRVETTGEALAFRNLIGDVGGEGIMLRRAGSAYQEWRTDDLLKMKVSAVR